MELAFERLSEKNLQSQLHVEGFASPEREAGDANGRSGGGERMTG
jgi:hypothetical protein